MKKLLILLCSSLSLTQFISAYNPPTGGQNLLKLSSPELLTGAKSAAGGALYDITPDSVVINPALPAYRQNSSLQFAGTLLLDKDDKSDKSTGGAFEIGSSIATSWCVPTFLIQGVFSPFYDMHLGKSINATAAYSKDISDNLSVGLSLNAGYLWGDGSDWTASLGLGTYYNFGDISFLKDFRLGVALTNLGKMYTKTEVIGIEKDKAKDWPGLATMRIGVASNLLEMKDFKLGTSFDLALPSFQNLVIDAGLQMKMFDKLKLSTAWEYDIKEYKKDAKNLIPSISLSFNFIFKNESEVKTSAAYQRMYKNVNAISAGVTVDMGLKDTDAPDITLW